MNLSPYTLNRITPERYEFTSLGHTHVLKAIEFQETGEYYNGNTELFNLAFDLLGDNNAGTKFKLYRHFLDKNLEMIGDQNMRVKGRQNSSLIVTHREYVPGNDYDSIILIKE